MGRRRSGGSSDYFRVATTESFGLLSRIELTAAAACVTYVERTQFGKRPPLSPPLRESAGASLAIDAATRANLELLRTLSGERRGSLFSAIDRTITSAGSRLLAQHLAAPLTDPDAISHRLDAVEFFTSDPAVRSDVRSQLKAAPDLARALTRLVVGRGGPRDLAAIRDGLAASVALASRLSETPELPADIAQRRRRIETAIAKPVSRPVGSPRRRIARIQTRRRLHPQQL